MDQFFCEITKTIWYLDPQYYTIFTALLLGLAGIFQDGIRHWFSKPRISIDIKLEPPDCHKIPMKGGALRYAIVIILDLK